MKSFILMILKNVGSKLLLELLGEISDTLKKRKDNTMFNDADKIKALAKRNKAK